VNNAGDAAEQIIRMSLMGMEYSFRITGAAAKNIAAFLFAALSGAKSNDCQKLSGKEHLHTMLRSGKEVKVFKIRNENLKTFYQRAKLYGVVYTLVRNKKGDWSDLMVKAEDASKINRIMEEIELVPSGQLSSAEIIDNGELKIENEGVASGEKNHSPLSTVNSQLKENPSPARTKKKPLSEPSYARRSRYERASSEPRPSVRQDLKEIAERRKGANSPTREKSSPTIGTPETPHIPQNPRVLTRKNPFKER